MELNLLNSMEGESTIFVSPSTTTTSTSCITFWLHLSTVGEDKVSSFIVAYLDPNEAFNSAGHVLWKHTGYLTEEWIEIQVNIPPGKFRLAFTGVAGNPKRSTLAFGAISSRNSPCRNATAKINVKRMFTHFAPTDCK